MAPQLAIVVAVLEEEHVTRAAERLGVPQPTVSATMRRVGDVIRTPLVQLWGRGIVATAAGRALLPAAREALMTLRAARHELQDVIDPDKGLVALGFLHTLGVRDVPRLLDAFLAAYPDISFSLKQGPAHHLVNQMRAGALDIVIVAPLPDDTDGLESVVLRRKALPHRGRRSPFRRPAVTRPAAGRRRNLHRADPRPRTASNLRQDLRRRGIRTSAGLRR